MNYYLRPAILDKIDPRRSTLIEASAGTGKTFTIEHLVVELLISGAATIEEILLVTFTEKAVGELKVRIRATIQRVLNSTMVYVDGPEAPEKKKIWLLDKDNCDRLKQALANYDQATIVTIHGFCNRVLREHPISTKQPLSCKLVDDKTTLKVALAKVLTKAQYRDDQVKDLLAKMLAECSDIKECIDGINKTINNIVTYNAPIFPSINNDLDDNDSLQPSVDSQLIQNILADVREEQLRIKRELGEISYNDILVNVATALKDPESGPTFAKTLLKSFPYGIIDEFQDTDEVQWSIFKHIYFNEEAPGVLYLVGDPKQAIYGFRGADVKSYLAAKNMLQNSGSGNVIDLDTNFRSTTEMVDALNIIFDSQTEEPFFTQEISCPPTIKVGNKAAKITYPKGKETSEERKLPPVILGYIDLHVAKGNLNKDDFCEKYNRWLACYLKGLLWYKPQVVLKDGQSERPLRPSDIFILGATNSELHDIAKHLKRVHIPYTIFKEDGLFSGPEAKDIADLLAAIADPYNEPKRLKAFLSPFIAVPLNELAYYKELPSNHLLMTKLTWWQQLAEQHHYAELFSSIIQDSGLAARILFSTDDMRELHTYQRIFDILAGVANQNRYELSEILDILLQYIDGTRVAPNNNDDLHQQQFSHEAVQLLTMHKAKGLEAPVVAIAGGFSSKEKTVNLFYDQNDSRQLFIGPYRDYQEINDRILQNKVSERQRLMYVSLTRASCELILPFWDHDTQKRTLEKGACWQVNKRLQYLASQDKLTPNLFKKYIIVDELARQEGRLATKCNYNFLYRELPPDRATQNEAQTALPVTLQSPAEALLQLATAKEQLQGPFITSYSRLKHLSGHGYTVDFDDNEINNNLPEEVTSLLPGGTTFGTMVHELFEEVDFQTVANNSFADWLQLTETQELLENKRIIYGFNPQGKEELARLIYLALAQESNFNGRWILPPLCQAPLHLHEVEFFYPAPNTADLSLFSQIPQLTVDRGYIKGYLDMIFTYEGRYYVLDWKTDRLANYQESTIAQHVEKNYQIQEQLYSLALCKVLKIQNADDYHKKFGGLIYLFVRGTEPACGRYFHRASWDELQQNYQQLAIRPLG